MKKHIFKSEQISDSLFNRINGFSFKDNDKIRIENLRYLSLTHMGFDRQSHVGELICNKIIAEELLVIFEELFANNYEIEKIRLIDDYGADDDLSMAANNSSCFNYRTIANTDILSKHGMGLAVDINPLFNPYVKRRPDGTTLILPPEGKEYADRESGLAHIINKHDLCYRLFTEHGFEWGGEWINCQDYQHFEKKTDYEV